jgi:hypothetical protein
LEVDFGIAYVFCQTVTQCTTTPQILQVPNKKKKKNLSSMSHSYTQAGGWVDNGNWHFANYASALKQQAPIFIIRCNFSWSLLHHKMAW